MSIKIYSFFLALGTIGVLLQLWGPDGVVPREHELAASLERQLAANAVEQSVNNKLAAELYSLENKRAAIEERARRELYMVRPDELLVRLELPEEAAARDRSVAEMPDYSDPDIPPGSRPTFRPKKDYLYFAPKNLRAWPSRFKRK